MFRSPRSTTARFGISSELAGLPVGVNVDSAIARIAARQHGVVSRGQLLAMDIGADAINHRLARERLHPVHRGVYLVGHPVAPPLAKEMAAMLACGEGAILSHESAACAVWRLCAASGGPTRVTLPSRSNRSRPGIRVHRIRALEPRDVRRRHGMQVTAPARTILDLAQVFGPRELRRAYEEARIQRLVRNADLRAAMDRSPGHRGAPAVRALLATDVTPSLTRSEAEARLLELLRAAGLPPSATNTRVGRHEVELSVAPRAADRRSRRLRLPRQPRRLRARPSARRGAPRSGLPRDARHLAPDLIAIRGRHCSHRAGARAIAP